MPSKEAILEEKKKKSFYYINELVLLCFGEDELKSDVFLVML